jgi:high-affinity nickel permease
LARDNVIVSTIQKVRFPSARRDWLATEICGTLAVVSTALAIAALGFLLGMRHATDSDHVIAVATIVSREKSTVSAAIVGALWGLGHTTTITIVGAAIILFKMRIPPRLGLSMELLVACMLILLGALNLTGVMVRIMR